MVDLRLHPATFYGIGSVAHAELWLSHHPVTDQANQVIAIQVDVTTDPDRVRGGIR